MAEEVQAARGTEAMPTADPNDPPQDPQAPSLEYPSAEAVLNDSEDIPRAAPITRQRKSDGVLRTRVLLPVRGGMPDFLGVKGLEAERITADYRDVMKVTVNGSQRALDQIRDVSAAYFERLWSRHRPESDE